MTPGLLVAAVAALLTFVASFLTWATVTVSSRAGNAPLVGGGTRSVIGLQGDRLGKATLVLAIVSLVLAGLVLAGLLTGAARQRWAWIALAGCGALIAVLALIDLVAISDTSDLKQRLAQVPGCTGAVVCRGDRSAGVGVWLTLLAGLAVVVGALLHARVLPGPLTRLGRLRMPGRLTMPDRLRRSRQRPPAAPPSRPKPSPTPVAAGSAPPPPRSSPPTSPPPTSPPPTSPPPTSPPPEADGGTTLG